jgi:hypothetical protein
MQGGGGDADTSVMTSRICQMAVSRIACSIVCKLEMIPRGHRATESGALFQDTNLSQITLQ